MELYQVGIRTPFALAFDERSLMPSFLERQDQRYLQILSIPPTGLNLKTKIYVAVAATNLTDRWVRMSA